MSNVRLVLLWAVVIGCLGTACQKRIKTTSFIVAPNLSASPGISVGGKLQWVTSDGPPFVIHFYSESPCVGGQNDIPGTKDAPAVCAIRPGMNGRFKFAVLAQGESALGNKNIMYAAVDWCPPKACKGVTLYSPVRIPGPPVVPIDCDDSGKASADPQTLSVFAGQQILWQQVGPDATTNWETDVPAPVCQEGTTFGTIVPNSPLGCTVSSNAKVGETYSYNLKYANGTLKKSCQGTANLVITAPPGQR